ncbi:hypothetical protein D3C83_02910 [compost metagenome]
MPACDRDQFVGLMEFQRDRLFEKNVLAGEQAFACHRVVQGLRCRGNITGVDFRDLHQIAVISGCRDRARCRGDFGQPLGPGFGEMQVLHPRICGAGLRPDPAAPAGADNTDIDLFHGCFPCLWSG